MCSVVAARKGAVNPIVGLLGWVDCGKDGGGFGEPEMHQGQRLDVKVVDVEVVVLVGVPLQAYGEESTVAMIGGEVDVLGVPSIGVE